MPIDLSDINSQFLAPSQPEQAAKAPSTPAAPATNSSSGMDISGVNSAFLAPSQAEQVNPKVGTAGYIGTRGLGGFLEGGRALATGANLEMGNTADADETANMPTGYQTANKAVYGTPNVEPPNTFARYAGAVAGAAGENPVLAAVAPQATVRSALGGEGGADLNAATGSYIPDWASRLIGSVVGGYTGAASEAKAANAPSAAAQSYADASVTPPPRVVAQASPNTSIIPGMDQGLNLNRFNPISRREAVNSSLEKSVDTLAEDTSGQTGTDNVGSLVKKDVQQWITDKRAGFDDAYNNQVRGNIDPTKEAPPDQTTDLLTSAKPVAKGADLPQPLKDVQNALNEGEGNFNYDDYDYQVKTLRKFTGSRDYSALPYKQQQQVQELKSALENDRLAYVGSQNPDAANVLQQTDDAYRDFSSVRPQAAKTIENNEASGSDVWKKIASRSDPDAQDYAKLVDSGAIGQDAQKAVAAQFIRQAGTDPSGKFNPNLFFKNFRNMSDTAKGNIFGYDPDLLGQYNNLGKIAGDVANNSSLSGKGGLRYLLGKLGPAAEVGGGLEAVHNAPELLASHPYATAAAATTWAMSRLMATKPVVNYLSKPVTSQDKFIAGLKAIATMHPEISGDVKTVSDALQRGQQGQGNQ